MKRLPRTLVAALAVAAIPALPAAAKPPELAGRVEAARPAGCYDYSYLLWDLYRAELWRDAATLPGKSFALSLIYHTNFTRGSLVDSSIDEMARFSGGEPVRFAAALTHDTGLFLDIWLGPKARHGAGRDDLLAGRCDG